MKLIDKDALVAEIENLENTYKKCPTHNSYEEALKDGRLIGYKDTLDKINTIEVKEVDLEKELESWRHCHFHGRRDIFANGEYLERVSQLDIAKHFFELGMRSIITEEDCKLIWNIGDEIPNMPEEEFFKELLKRYKSQKGE